MPGPLKRINGMEVWKQYALIAATVGGAFMTGMNVTGVIHTFDRGIHQTVADKEAAMHRLVDPIRTNQASSMMTLAVVSQRLSSHEEDAGRRFGELTKRLDEILIELRKR